MHLEKRLSYNPPEENCVKQSKFEIFFKEPLTQATPSGEDTKFKRVGSILKSKYIN